MCKAALTDKASEINKGCPYCHDFDGSEEWVPPTVVNFPIQPFSNYKAM